MVRGLFGTGADEGNYDQRWPMGNIEQYSLPAAGRSRIDELTSRSMRLFPNRGSRLMDIARPDPQRYENHENSQIALIQ